VPGPQRANGSSDLILTTRTGGGTARPVRLATPRFAAAGFAAGRSAVVFRTGSRDGLTTGSRAGFGATRVADFATVTVAASLPRLASTFATAPFAALAPFVNLSLHAAGVAGTLVCLLLVFGLPGALFAPVLPLVWWARVKLGRHTHPELALGTLAGGVLTWVAFTVTA